MKNKRGRLRSLYMMAFMIIISFAVLVSAAINFIGDDSDYLNDEGEVYIHDFNDYMNPFGGNYSFYYDSESNVRKYNDSTNQITIPNFILNYDYFILNSTGNLTINVTTDVQTGKYEIPFQVKNNSEDTDLDVAYFTFIINATNDNPQFLSGEEYVYVYPTDDEGMPEPYYVNVTDEEDHFPGNFSINWFNNCSHADWLENPKGNCYLFNISLMPDGKSAYFNYTINGSDIGRYWANVTMEEAEHSCPHEYCVNETYNITHMISQIIMVEVQSQLSVDVSNCSGRIFNEGEDAWCIVSIQTRGEQNSVNVSSVASFLNYGGAITNSSWFYPLDRIDAIDYGMEINISVNTTLKRNIGDWIINWSTRDLNVTTDFNWTEFSFQINRTFSEIPMLTPIPNVNAHSVLTELEINYNVTDDDFLIEDKSYFNEDITHSIYVVNSSGDEAINVNFAQISNSPQIRSNLETTSLTWTPDVDDVGNYTVFLNVTDLDGNLNQTSFNISIFMNNYPVWENLTYSHNLTVNSTRETSFENLTNYNLTDTGYASDPDLSDTLSFSIEGTSPTNFNLQSNGILNFIPWKSDVGYYEFNITASDGALTNKSLWIINVTNINSEPVLDNSTFTMSNDSFVWDPVSGKFNHTVNQSSLVTMTFSVYDEDSKINDLYYNENLTVVSSFTSINGAATETPDFDFEIVGEVGNQTQFRATHLMTYENVGNYSVVINVTDEENESDSFEFNLFVLEKNNEPIINNLEDEIVSILNDSFVFYINATDEEDDIDNLDLNYSLFNLTVGAPELVINESSGEISFDFDNNQSYSGEWNYNIYVKDSRGDSTSENWTLTVEGRLQKLSPSSPFVFDMVENETYNLTFAFDYTINNSNFSYFLYLDDVVSYENNTYNETTNELINSEIAYNYTNLILRENDNFIWNETNSNLTIYYSPNFSGETYGKKKNMSLLIVNNVYNELNTTFNFPNVNITHKNENISFSGYLSDKGPTTAGTTILVDLTNYFNDEDYSDVFYNQLVNYSLQTVSGDSIIQSSSTFSGWTLNLYSASASSAVVNVVGYEWDENNNSLGNATSNDFNVTFTAPEETVVPDPTPNPTSGGGSSGENTKYYSLKIIAPDSVQISDQDYIELNFSLINNGNVDLEGIDLSSTLELGGLLNTDLEIELSDNYIDILKIGEQRKYSMRVEIGNDAVGKYEIKIWGNVTKPKFTDWGYFFIEVLPLDKDELTQLLVFTEQMIVENPECIELKEVLNRANAEYDLNNFIEAQKLAKAAISSCEDMIENNPRVKFSLLKNQQAVILTIGVTFSIIFMGYGFYLIRRIRFKKFKGDSYV